VVRFETSGRAKQPIFPYEEIVISLPFDHDGARDAARAESQAYANWSRLRPSRDDEA
jgi:hypothetical protein